MQDLLPCVYAQIIFYVLRGKIYSNIRMEEIISKIYFFEIKYNYKVDSIFENYICN
jgi:hypothetical protein